MRKRIHGGEASDLKLEIGYMYTRYVSLLKVILAHFSITLLAFKIVTWKAQGVPEEEETSPIRNHIIK